jgi:hypothetical protein
VFARDVICEDRQVLPRTKSWLDSWNRVKELPEAELQAYILKKCRNGFQVAKKPARNQRDAWVTMLAEPDNEGHELSPLARRVMDFVRDRLTEEGYDFEVNVDHTGGVVYAEAHFKTLTRKTP